MKQMLVQRSVSPRSEKHEYRHWHRSPCPATNDLIMRIEQRCAVVRLSRVEKESIEDWTGLNLSKLPHGELLCFRRSAVDGTIADAMGRLGIIVEIA